MNQDRHTARQIQPAQTSGQVTEGQHISISPVNICTQVLYAICRLQVCADKMNRAGLSLNFLRQVEIFIISSLRVH